VPPPHTALAGLSTGRHPFLLQSASPGGRFGAFSFAGADPFLTVTSRGAEVTIARADRTEVVRADALEVLGKLLQEHRREGDDDGTPLPGGAVGFISYDFARRLEKLPETTADDLALPDLFFAFYDSVITWNHATGKATVGASDRAGELLALAQSGKDTPLGIPRLAAPLRSTFSRPEYLEAVRRVKDLIAAGDIFQVNLSQRFATEVTESGLAIYRRVTQTNPAAFAAYLTSPCGAEVVSSSPERFFRVTGRQVEACPIKGTRPRSENPEEDRRLARELLQSEKDRAELTMIVDLLRSDIGRVARFGTVRVRELAGLTSHATVHHLNATITGELAEGRDVTDLLRATFPCGSITGAPKVRAMEIIEELEPVRRGVYTGAIGYFSFTGQADFNVAIRTLVVKNQQVTFSVGGGIVADSDPEMEYRETLSKGRGMAAALGFVM
jgi:para-aminobenzoate synthetase component I